jgi:hypothetical protein
LELEWRRGDVAPRSVSNTCTYAHWWVPNALLII